MKYFILSDQAQESGWLKKKKRIWLVRNYLPYCLEAPVVNIEWMLVSFEISSLSLSALGKKRKNYQVIHYFGDYLL